MPMPHLLGIFTDIYGSLDAMTLPRALLISLVGFITVMVVLGVIALFIKLIAYFFSLADKKAKKNAPAESDANSAPLPTNESQGSLKLENVDEQTAAVVMALVSHKSGIPLNRLEFKSIRLMEDKK
jgi:Na+-transporting methylmalonyl-CoA/oxaloacetate decarboxylase gamma subunit